MLVMTNAGHEGGTLMQWAWRGCPFDRCEESVFQISSLICSFGQVLVGHTVKYVEKNSTVSCEYTQAFKS